jgi:predicted nucleic acid-binding protein
MAYLTDTNVLLRWAQPQLPQHGIAVDAVAITHRQGETTFITPLNLIEFWAVATRPLSANGLGMLPVQADEEVARVEQFFPLLPDTPDIFAEWRRLVVTVGVSGRQVHDARLVSVMLAHGVTHLLTFNPGDFTRYPGITVVHPQDIVAGPGTEEPSPTPGST